MVFRTSVIKLTLDLVILISFIYLHINFIIIIRIIFFNLIYFLILKFFLIIKNFNYCLNLLNNLEFIFNTFKCVRLNLLAF